MSKFIAVTEYSPELVYTSIDAIRKQHIALGKVVVDAEAVAAARVVSGSEIDQKSFIQLIVPGAAILVASDDAALVIGQEAVDALLA